MITRGGVGVKKQSEESGINAWRRAFVLRFLERLRNRCSRKHRISASVHNELDRVKRIVNQFANVYRIPDANASKWMRRIRCIAPGTRIIHFSLMFLYCHCLVFGVAMGVSHRIHSINLLSIFPFDFSFRLALQLRIRVLQTISTMKAQRNTTHTTSGCALYYFFR